MNDSLNGPLGRDTADPRIEWPALCADCGRETKTLPLGDDAYCLADGVHRAIEILTAPATGEDLGERALRSDAVELLAEFVDHHRAEVNARKVKAPAPCPSCNDTGRVFVDRSAAGSTWVDCGVCT